MSRRHHVQICVVCNGPQRKIPSPRYVAIAVLRRRNGDNCAVCARPIRFDLFSKTAPHVASPSLDHICKQADGGCDHIANFQLTHTGCNHWRDQYGTPLFDKLFTERIAPHLKFND